MKIALFIIAALEALHIHNVARGAPALIALDNDQASHVKPPDNIETVVHQKKANGGYKKGSPLYNKQEGIGTHKHHKHQAIEGHKRKHHRRTEAHHAAKEAHKAYWAKPSFYEYLASVSVYAILVLAVAYVYRNRQASLPLGAPTKGDTPMKLPVWTRCGFTYSFFDCGNLQMDWPLCLTSYCCPIVQWAATASGSITPFMSYWKAVGLLLALVVLTPFTYGLTGVVIMFILLKRRRELRKNFNHSHPDSRSWVEDICLTFCCNSFLCCQLVQEAREVEYSCPHPKETA